MPPLAFSKTHQWVFGCVFFLAFSLATRAATNGGRCVGVLINLTFDGMNVMDAGLLLGTVNGVFFFLNFSEKFAWKM